MTASFMPLETDRNRTQTRVKKTRILRIPFPYMTIQIQKMNHFPQYLHLSISHSISHTLFLTLTHTQSHSLTLSLSHTHTLSHSPHHEEWGEQEAVHVMDLRLFDSPGHEGIRVIGNTEVSNTRKRKRIYERERERARERERERERER